MTSVLACTRCGGERIERRRETLAGELERAVALADRAGERKWQALTAQLSWFACELRGRCTNCTLEECAGAFEAAQEKPTSGARCRPRLQAVKGDAK